jgi:DNA-binding CsgD family transcriptional regulator
LPPLTPREFEIALLASAGLPSRLIARRLWLSARTVDNHLGRVYTKLRIDGRHALIQSVRPEPSLATGDTREGR